MAFTSATVTHTFTNADNTPASGAITFWLTGRITNGTTTIIPSEITSNLNATGQLTVTLWSNVDAGTIPQTTQWRVDMRILGANAESYFITVPTGGGTVDLGSLLPQNTIGG